MNASAQLATVRKSTAVKLSTSRMLSIRSRRNQEPAATPTETERGANVVSTSVADSALAETWGWA